MAIVRTRVGGHHQVRLKKNGMIDKRTTPESISLAAVYCTTFEEEAAFLARKTPQGFHYLPSPSEIERVKKEIREENREREGISCVEHSQRTRADNFAVKTYNLDVRGQGGRHGKII